MSAPPRGHDPLGLPRMSDECLALIDLVDSMDDVHILRAGLRWAAILLDLEPTTRRLMAGITTDMRDIAVLRDGGKA